MIGYHGTTLADMDTTADALRKGIAGNLVLFDRNVVSPDQLATFTTDVSKLTASPPLISIDQEGGYVARLRPDKGFPDTVTALYLGSNGLALTRQYGDSIARTLKAAGINLKVVREPNDGYYSDVWLKKSFTAVSWGARPTPDVMFTLAYKSDAAWNESHWQNERFNELLLQAKAELDQDRRAEMYHEMCQLMRDDGGTLIPFFNNFVYARNKKVQHGPDLAASWACDGGRAPSRWWFEG